MIPLVLFRCLRCHDAQSLQSHARRCKCGDSGGAVSGGEAWAWGPCEVVEVVQSVVVEGARWVPRPVEGDGVVPATREEARVMLAGALGVEPMRVGLNELVAMAVPLLRRA